MSTETKDNQVVDNNKMEEEDNDALGLDEPRVITFNLTIRDGDKKQTKSIQVPEQNCMIAGQLKATLQDDKDEDELSFDIPVWEDEPNRLYDVKENPDSYKSALPKILEFMQKYGDKDEFHKGETDAEKSDNQKQLVPTQTLGDDVSRETVFGKHNVEYTHFFGMTDEWFTKDTTLVNNEEFKFGQFVMCANWLDIPFLLHFFCRAVALLIHTANKSTLLKHVRDSERFEEMMAENRKKFGLDVVKSKLWCDVNEVEYKKEEDPYHIEALQELEKREKEVEMKRQAEADKPVEDSAQDHEQGEDYEDVQQDEMKIDE